jgi:uncharacterized protein (DUF1778 family)
MSSVARRERSRDATRTSRRETSKRERRDAVVNVRLSHQARELINQAADAIGKSRSEFIVESARSHAIEVLLDKRIFSLGTEQYAAFMTLLEARPAPNAKLKKLMKSKAPWEP